MSDDEGSEGSEGKGIEGSVLSSGFLATRNQSSLYFFPMAGDPDIEGAITCFVIFRHLIHSFDSSHFLHVVRPPCATTIGYRSR